MKQYPVAKINLAALRHNFQRIKQLAPHSRVMSVIKADAYGHGVFNVANALADTDAFAVARMAEAVELREAGITHPILVLEGANTAAEFILAAELDISPLFHLQQQIALFLSLTLKKPLQFNWLMINSGMNRLGIRPEQVDWALTQLQAHPAIEGEIGLLSHFANADLIGDERNQQQLAVMQKLKQQTGLAVCVANSAAVLSLPEARQEWVRPGLMLYGISPFADQAAADLDLQPVMQLTTQLIAVYDCQAGDEIGYGGTWTATKRCRIGVASIGYGDGYRRDLSHQADVLIHQQRLPIVGRVSMDTICILLDDLPEATVGDEVVLWGHPELGVEQLATKLNTIPYELVTVLCPRVRREIHDG